MSQERCSIGMNIDICPGDMKGSSVSISTPRYTLSSETECVGFGMSQGHATYVMSKDVLGTSKYQSQVCHHDIQGVLIQSVKVSVCPRDIAPML